MHEEDSQIFAEADKLFEEERYHEALENYRALAVQGYAHAYVMVGWMYEQGLGIEKQENEAINWYSKAAEIGSSVAEFNLGVLSMRRRDYEMGRQWYHKAASKGYMPAVYRLGWLYKDGTGIPVDKDKAFEFFSRGARMGHVFSQMALARMLMSGYQGLFPIVKGFYLFIKSAIQAPLVAYKDNRSDRIRE